MPTPPRRAGKASGRSGGAPDMMARATAQASRDASALFAHLDDRAEAASLDSFQIERERAALTLERLASQIRAGAWTAELADLLARAEHLVTALESLASD